MKTGKTIQELAQEIARQQENKRDYLVNVGKTGEMDCEGRFMIRQDSQDLNAQRYPVSAHAHSQIATYTGIPKAYYDRVLESAPAHLASHVNLWFDQAEKPKRMIRILDDKMRAFLSNSYQRIDNVDVMERVLPVLMQHEDKGLVLRSSEVTANKLYLKFSFTQIRAEIKSRREGDVLESGILISNSEIGLGAVNVQPYLYFLACTNGMVGEKGLSARHLGTRLEEEGELEISSDRTKMLMDKLILSRVQDVLEATLNQGQFLKMVENIQQLNNFQLVGAPDKVVENTAKLLNMTQTESSFVLRHLCAGGDLSRYGLMNAVTRTAEDVSCYDRATEIEAMGSKIVNLTPGDWKMVDAA